ncbi:MAG: hypothetical protein ACI87O_000846 [Planctomycetota bacterium]|jgi:hypothetical protein
MKAPTFLALAAACLLATAWAAPQGTPEAPTAWEAPTLTFSAPSLGKVWAAVGPETQPSPLPLKAAALGSQPFGPVVVKAWSRALQIVRDPLAPLGERLQARLSLCLIAKSQGRDQDAWKHFQKLGDGPEEIARALPHMWPGVPFETSIGKGARLSLEPNTMLRPAFPLLPDDDAPNGTGPLRMTWKGGLKVQDQDLELRFTLQPEGLEMDLWNRGNDTLSIRTILPSPRNFECSYTYSDWEKTMDPHLGIAVQLPPDREDPWTLFSRLRPAFEAWPASPKQDAEWFEDRSMRLILGPGEPATPALATLAKVLRDLLSVPVEFGAMGDKTPPRCVIVDLGPQDAPSSETAPSGSPSPRQARMRRLLSSVELFLVP